MVNFQVYTYLVCLTGLSCQLVVAQTPDVKIEVNKEYDEKGNVIRYDSMYSYSYGFSNMGRASFFDSIFRHFGLEVLPSDPETHRKPTITEKDAPHILHDPFDEFRDLMELQRQFMEKIMEDPPCRRNEQKPCCPGKPTPHQQTKPYPGEQREL